MKKRLIWLFYVLFAVCFTFILINVIFKNPYYNTLPLIIITLVCLILLTVIYRLICKYGDIDEKKYKRILLVFAAVMFLLQITAGLILRYDPAWDVGAVQNGAKEWVETGAFSSFYSYYYDCPNNLGPMAILAFFYKIAYIFGIRDSYAVYVVVTSLIMTTIIVLVSLICVRLRDIKRGLFALALFALSPQFYFMGGAIYSDTMSMIFPMLCFWLYLRASCDDIKESRKLLLYILIGLSAAIGAIAKFTSAVIVVAILIDICFKKKPKELIEAGVCIVGIMLIVNLAFNGMIYSNYLDKETANLRSKPLQQWTMMGLSGDGRYNPGDWSYTDGISDPKERKEVVNAEIVNRIKALGVSGMYELTAKKSALNFGDGTYGIADPLGMPKNNTTKLDAWVLYNGEHYNIYAIYATAIHIALLIIALLNAFGIVFKRNDKANETLIPYLSLFGIWLVLLAWETNRRYIMTFTPMIFICASVGMYSFNNALNGIKKKLKKL